VIRTEEFGNVNKEEFLTILERGRRRLLFLDFRDPAKLLAIAAVAAIIPFVSGVGVAPIITLAT